MTGRRLKFTTKLVLSFSNNFEMRTVKRGAEDFIVSVNDGGIDWREKRPSRIVVNLWKFVFYINFVKIYCFHDDF
jgi:hypothetical protein